MYIAKQAVEAIDQTIEFLNKDHVGFLAGDYFEFADGSAYVLLSDFHNQSYRPCNVCLEGAFYGAVGYGKMCDRLDYKLDEGLFVNIENFINTYYQKLFGKSIVRYNDRNCHSKEDQINSLIKVKAAILADNPLD